jgi:hypothetical protein
MRAAYCGNLFLLVIVPVSRRASGAFSALTAARAAHAMSTSLARKRSQ